MTTILTENSWINRDTGEDLGKWTNETDISDLGDKIVVYRKVITNTLEGDDTIIGTSEREGINNFGTIQTMEGNDAITGKGEIAGIINNHSGTITTGEDNDTITGSDALIGIENLNLIKTEDGNDTIIGSGSISGISNLSIIETGDGSDTIDAFSGGFRGVGTINLGQGEDIIRGFGNQIVNGGDDNDTAELGLNFDEDLISLGSIDDNSIDITFNDQTMSFTNVERFDFNGQEFTPEELQNFI